MELIKGMIQDLPKAKAPEGSWSFAQNMVIGKHYRNVANEAGTSLIQENEFIVIGIISLNDGFVQFSTNTIFSKIEVFRNGVMTTIIRSQYMNFQPQNPIEGDFVYNFNKQLVITWRDGIADDANPPRLLNVDCLPFDLNINKEFINPEDVDLLLLQPVTNNAQFLLNAVTNTGGRLKSGVYYFLFAYVLKDGNVTNYSGISNPVSVNDDADSVDFKDYDGCEPDTQTSKSIDMRLIDVDTRYEKLSIAVISKIGGVVSAGILPDISIDNNTTIGFILSSFVDLTVKSVGEIITPLANYTRAKTGCILNEQLYLGNLKVEDELDYQPYANNIKSKWIRERTVALASNKNSYKDPVIIFDKKGFMMNEVYAFYIIFKLKDGTFSKAFHIPARAVLPLTDYDNLPENTNIQDIITAGFPEDRFDEALLINENVKYHQVFNSALSDGTMSYWENENETYPDLDCFDVKDSTGVIGNIRGQKVRHHKFPSLKKLVEFGKKFYEETGTSLTDKLLEVQVITADPLSDNWTAGNNRECDFTSTIANPTYFNILTLTDQTVVDVVSDISGYINFRLSIDSPLDIRVEISIIRFATGTFEYIYTETANGGLFNPAEITKTFGDFYNLLTGDKIVIRIIIDSNAIIVRYPAVDFSFSFTEDELTDSDVSSKILGIQFSDIYIPDDIKSKIVGYTFGYAQRTVLNSTKLGQGKIDRQFEFRGFDILKFKPTSTASYVDYEMTLTAATGQVYLFENAPTYQDEQQFRSINKSLYIPADVVLPVDNSNKDEYFRIEQPTIISFAGVVIGSIYTYKTNCYKEFYNQKIAVMNTYFNVDTTEVEELYNGDCFISLFGLYNGLTKSDNYDFKVFVNESASNIGYRHTDTVQDIQYPPHSAVGGTWNQSYGNGYVYNEDYSSLNNIIPIQIEKCEEKCSPDEKTNAFPYRVARSVKIGSEEYKLGIRRFLLNSYYEMTDRGKGEIWQLEKLNNTLLIHQKFSLFVAQIRDVIYANNVETYLGSGDIFDRQPNEVVADNIGYIGCQSQWCAFVCKHGYVVIDRMYGKVFLYSGQVDELSNKGMKNFFKDNSQTLQDVDNPFLGIGWCGTFDENNNRIILAKTDATEDSFPFTISYSFDLQAWFSFHTYRPNGLWYNRLGLFGVVNGSELSTYIHKGGEVGLYYGASIQPSFIDVIFATPYDVKKLLSAICWDTLSSIYGEEISTNHLNTITQIIVYTDEQCSGLIQLIQNRRIVPQYKNTRILEYDWFFNDFRDKTINRNDTIVFKDGSLNVANINNNKVWFDKSKFYSKFVVVRFQNDNTTGYTVELQKVLAVFKPSTR